MRLKLAAPLALAVLGATASAASAQTFPGLPTLPGRPPVILKPVEPVGPTVRVFNCKPIWIIKDGKVSQEQVCTGFEFVAAPPGNPIGTIRP